MGLEEMRNENSLPSSLPRVRLQPQVGDLGRERASIFLAVLAWEEHLSNWKEVGGRAGHSSNVTAWDLVDFLNEYFFIFCMSLKQFSETFR